MEVLVFKTNVSKQTEVSKVQTLLKRIAAIEDWNFDSEDCNCVLRIVASNLSPRHIESVLRASGINCEELE